MNEREPLRILIADDHPLFLTGLRMMIENDAAAQIVAEAYDGASAWSLMQRLQPKIAILDLEMPELNGLEIARLVGQQRLQISLIILTMHKEESLFRQAVELGVLGYLLKEDLATDLAPCLRSVIARRRFVAPALSGYLGLLGAGENLTKSSDLDAFTVTQQEILKLLAHGRTTQDIAGELGISCQTVENHCSRMVEKLALGTGFDGLRRFALRLDQH